ncbi:MAG: tetratricopeptide repeat protein [Bacteroidales bacterium]|nr:tetratricopeptide repeat protein [Bacteroidales bacterium]
MKLRILLFVLCLLSFIPSYSQSERSLVRRGNRDIEKERYHDAEIKYRKALEENRLMEEAGFNLGNSLYLQDKYQEADSQYFDIASRAKNDSLKEASYYNLGNSFYKSEQYDGAVQAYKQALRINPDDEDARYNLAMAQKKLKDSEGQNGGQNQDQQNQNQQNQNQQNQNQQNQNQQNQNQQNQNQQNQQQQNQDEQQGQEQQQQQGQQDEQQDGEQQEAQQMNISKDDAERMLEALKNNEQKTLQKVQESKTKGQKVKIDKDW